jgi:hypothetical protein
MKEPTVNNGNGQVKSYVVAGAKIFCNFACNRKKIRLPKSHGVYIKEKALLNVMDYKPNKNILSFGVCTSPKNPNPNSPNSCTPKIKLKWVNGKEDMLVENQPALLNTCTTKCAYGGKITIVDDGQ